MPRIGPRQRYVSKNPSDSGWRALQGLWVSMDQRIQLVDYIIGPLHHGRKSNVECGI